MDIRKLSRPRARKDAEFFWIKDFWLCVSASLRRSTVPGLSLLVFLSACSPAKHYDLKGQVLAVNRDKQEVLVKHEEIPGFMMAMTMP